MEAHLAGSQPFLDRLITQRTTLNLEVIAAAQRIVLSPNLMITCSIAPQFYPGRQFWVCDVIKTLPQTGGERAEGIRLRLTPEVSRHTPQIAHTAWALRCPIQHLEISSVSEHRTVRKMELSVGPRWHRRVGPRHP